MWITSHVSGFKVNDDWCVHFISLNINPMSPVDTPNIQPCIIELYLILLQRAINESLARRKCTTLSQLSGE